MSREGREAAPVFQLSNKNRQGCSAAPSRHKAAPTADMQVHYVERFFQGWTWHFHTPAKVANAKAPPTRNVA